MSGTSFPLVRGRVMRATKLDKCGTPVTGAESVVVTEGFVSVGMTAEINEAEEIEVKNANGKTCVRDPGCPEFKGYSVEIAFCNVDPCLFSMLTGQDSIVDAQGEVVGFKMNSKVSACDNAFALEVWAGVPGVACTGTDGAFGYVLLPFIQSGVIGDFTIENAAITFTVTGAKTLDGNAWGVGPYNVVNGIGDTPAKLAEALDANDHLAVLYTEVAPPAATDGCVAFPVPA
jgi:hypothetical protein